MKADSIKAKKSIFKKQNSNEHYIMINSKQDVIFLFAETALRSDRNKIRCSNFQKKPLIISKTNISITQFITTISVQLKDI